MGYPVDEYNIKTNFFARGLDSLALARIVSKLSDVLSTELPPTLLLEFPNVQELTQRLDKQLARGDFKPGANAGVEVSTSKEQPPARSPRTLATASNPIVWNTIQV